ncbi:MAG: serine hydroxymethyltransferase [Ilumatobacteraceae bacterium]|nr:serine hydroxymethyltransferase [Ilumatobacteraceae bacterium]
MSTTTSPQATPETTPGRAWLAADSHRREAAILEALAEADADGVQARIDALIDRNRVIHEWESLNLNPASNVMNPRAEAALAAGLGTRASLGHAGGKYEMGLEAIEEIEVIAADLACRVFGARYAEIRVGSGALANLYAFMATCQPGDSIIVPPATIGGHVTHRPAGAAGLYGLDVHECPIDAEHFTVDLDALAELAEAVRPKLITIGTSLNLAPHPVQEIRAIADGVGAAVLFDAAHACGMFAGRIWPSPLDHGADLMTMSTYKSLGGPAGGLVLTNRADLAERIDAIAYPGLTANFDAGKTAALAITMLDWLEFGPAYARMMVATAAALAASLEAEGLPVHRTGAGPTTSHQLAVDASSWGGGHQAALILREANLLACAIGLPGGGEMGGLRIGTPEIVRWGMTVADMPELANLIADGLRGDPRSVAPRTSAFRQRFTDLHFIRA